jgi:hypothetical protein
MTWRRWHPIHRLYYWLDLYAYGKPDIPDHNKVMSTVVVSGFLIGHFTGHPFSVQMTIALGAISFGPRIFGQFLHGREAKVEQAARLSGNVNAMPEDGDAPHPKGD